MIIRNDLGLGEFLRDEKTYKLCIVCTMLVWKSDGLISNPHCHYEPSQCYNEDISM